MKKRGLTNKTRREKGGGNFLAIITTETIYIFLPHCLFFIAVVIDRAPSFNILKLKFPVC